MANTSLLKKGAPPPRERATNIIHADPRKSEAKNKPLQVMIPPEIFDAFSAKAGETFGFSKGSKSQLFLTMWESYISMKR
ncbi:hypothetical protein JCM17846_33610 [Iodidimonas nitroreducens]|uniref:Uncharacterized protein n=1 Tax=Iodidimonas nitroreducens TaxID=1236968 RepID=A0A5A7NF19_9PROT|nr:hypothetical protein [Iodidimonas nitroreducens]GAK34521.1 hypothetical protein AQ1_02420 [alpha proteobacterium Q-1]GER05679.1 hypothetical protein JCM17846_33610 [Iodidimonas nitroreducens]